MAESDIPMVHPGGESTMLGQWRIVLRQAEEAARAGRFEEAYALASRTDVADHHQAVQLRGRLALDLIARANRRGAADDVAGAMEDLNLAERIGAPPDSLAAARLNLADRVADEIRADLDAGEPARVLERIEDLTRQKISGPALRRYREIAESWHTAQVEARRGEFGHAHEQLDRSERLAGGAGAIVAQNAMALTRRDLENRQKAAAPKVEALYTTLTEGKWPSILAAAEAVLVIVPDHPAARQARTRAWQQIAAIGPSTAAQWPQRGARAVQATAMMGLNPGPQPTEPISGLGHPAGESVEPAGSPMRCDPHLAPSTSVETEGIVWLSATNLRPAGSPPVGKPPGAAATAPPRPSPPDPASGTS